MSKYQGQHVQYFDDAKIIKHSLKLPFTQIQFTFGTYWVPIKNYSVLKDGIICLALDVFPYATINHRK